jgi:hypothetical protein
MPLFDESKMLLIAFALMGLATISLFFWFKQRISLVENKIETMFQLIQNHSEEPFEGSLDDPNFTMKENLEPTTNTTLNNTNDYINRDLMNVSDDDSDEVSDSVADSDDEVSDSDNDSDNDYDNDSDNNNKNNNHVINDIPIKTASLEELKNINIQKENLVKLDFNENDTDSLDALDNIDNEDDTKKVIVEEITNYNILKVSELKNECKKKGLEGYSNLKKQELVELLNKN